MEDLIDRAKNDDDTHFFGGVNFGLMNQYGRLVVGVEGDYSFFNNGVDTLRSHTCSILRSLISTKRSATPPS